jgi:non-ribosomal peptide synthetase component F
MTGIVASDMVAFSLPERGPRPPQGGAEPPADVPAGWPQDFTESSLPQRFLDQVRQAPGRLAIAGTDDPVTYGQLAALAALYGDLMHARCGGARGRATLLIDHGVSGVAAAIGAVQAGYVVSVLNPTDPPERAALIQQEVRPDVFVATEKNRKVAESFGFANTVILPELSKIPDDVPGPGLDGRGPGPNDLAFLISTSGSTGRPKLVMQTHRNLLHNVLRNVIGLGIGPDDRVAWLAALSGGQGLVTVWSALLTGGTLCPFPILERGLVGLAGWLDAMGVTLLDTVPSVFRNFVRTLSGDDRLQLRLLRLASEPSYHTDFEAFQAHCSPTTTLAVVLGSSETGIAAQALYRVDSEPGHGRLPVGRAAAGVQIGIVDDSGRAVRDGEVGRLVVRGRYLSPGYWRDESLTREKYRLDEEGVGEWQGGDLAQWAVDGQLVIVGRADSQVKVRGYRVQLEEVETAIGAHPEVSGVKVLARTLPSGAVRLTAYVTAKGGAAIDHRELWRWVGTKLPPHAVPRFRVLDAFPVTAHGKIDREQLDRLESVAAADQADAATETEEMIGVLWREAFDDDSTDLSASFFEAGGDSLTAAVMGAAIHDVFGVEVGLDFFSFDPTVVDLAARVIELSRNRTVDSSPVIPRVSRHDPLPLSHPQLQIWRGHRAGEAWNVVVPTRIRGSLDVEALSAALDQLVGRHEVLRTCFVERGGEPMAVVTAPRPVSLTPEPYQGSDIAAVLADVVISETHQPFDIESGEVIRFRLLQFGPEDFYLVRSNHHLVADAYSWKIFFDELRLLYLARVDGDPDPLGEAPAPQYVDYAAWARDRRHREPERYKAVLSFWERTMSAPPPPLNLPFRPPRDGPSAGGVQVVRWGLEPRVSTTLDRFARTCKATYFMSRLAVYAALLSYECRTDDLIVGTPVSMRSRSELQQMMGTFANFGFLRLRGGMSTSFRDWLTQVRSVVVDVTKHSDVPFTDLVADLAQILRARGWRLPPTKVSFAAAQPLRPMRFGGIELETMSWESPRSEVFRVGVNSIGERDRCWAQFDPGLIDPAAVHTFLGRLQYLTASVVEDPDQPLAEVCGRLPASRVN